MKILPDLRIFCSVTPGELIVKPPREGDTVSGVSLPTEGLQNSLQFGGASKLFYKSSQMEPFISFIDMKN